MLSPSMNLTVLPPSTFSAVSLLATTFQAAKSLTCCLPSGVKLLKSWSAAFSILPLVTSSSLTVTSSPFATVVRPFSPFTLNFTSPVLKDFSLVEPELPPKEILRPMAVVFLSMLSLLVAISLAFLVIAALLSAIFCLFAAILSLLVTISPAFLSIAALLSAIFCLLSAILSLLVAMSPVFLLIVALLSAIFCLLSAMVSVFLPILAVLSAILALFSAT